MDIAIEFALTVPNTAFNSVDFPLPLLPKRPMISPVETMSDACSKSRFLPKLMETLCNAKVAKNKMEYDDEY